MHLQAHMAIFTLYTHILCILSDVRRPSTHTHTRYDDRIIFHSSLYGETERFCARQILNWNNVWEYMANPYRAFNVPYNDYK